MYKRANVHRTLTQATAAISAYYVGKTLCTLPRLSQQVCAGRFQKVLQTEHACREGSQENVTAHINEYVIGDQVGRAALLVHLLEHVQRQRKVAGLDAHCTTLCHHTLPDSAARVCQRCMPGEDLSFTGWRIQNASFRVAAQQGKAHCRQAALPSRRLQVSEDLCASRSSTVLAAGPTLTQPCSHNVGFPRQTLNQMCRIQPEPYRAVSPRSPYCMPILSCNMLETSARHQTVW